ncbi:unnamed protein product [Microthlaspi erraticum]|uniref:Peptidase C1A papain C-terminal domain-containing protein n=1 Tax=Microthlaspi erraticum TaxID=1685480 RepID=A0A6D2I7G7_9BRAS|nr:unnamed protein product [Microthlaspi erraticum]
MDNEVEPSHGGGGGGKKKSSSSSSKKPKPSSSSSSSKKPQILKEGDSDYPKDLPPGAKHHEKFLVEELRDVIDQGARRICWTVASTGGLAADLKIEGKVTSLKHFSLLHLLVGLFDKTDNQGGLRKLEHLKTFMEEKGAILEKDCRCIDPIAEMKKKGGGRKSKRDKPVLCTHKDTPNSVFKVKKLHVVSQVVEKDLILLLDKRPVAISIVFHTEFAKFKGDGIYEGPKKGVQEDLDYHMVLCRGYGNS